MVSGMSAAAAAVNARRRVGTVPGPNVSTGGVPGMLRDDEGSGGGGVGEDVGDSEGLRGRLGG